MATMAEMETTIKELTNALEKAASRPAGGRAPAGVIGDINESWNQRRNMEWPVERLKALADSYGTNHGHDWILRAKNGQARVSGIGPALVKLAAINCPEIARQYAKSLPDWNDNYNQESLEEEFGFTTPMKAGKIGVTGKHWGLNKGQYVRKAALAEGAGATGGYVIPPQFQNELLTIAAEDGFIEDKCKVVPMNARSVQWPMLDITTVQTAGTTPYYGGVLAQWQPEAATINETEPAFKQTEWVAWDLVLYTVSSNQLLADNGIGLDALLTTLFGQAIAWYKEYAFLNGLGAGSTMPLGILKSPALLTQTKALAAHFTYADAAAMMSKLQVRSWNSDSTCWLFHQSVLPDLLQMQDFVSAAIPPAVAGGHLAWMPPFGTDSVGPAGVKIPKVFLNGLPVYFTEKLPKLAASVIGSACLFDFSRYVIGQRLDMQIDVSPHFLFRNNQLAWRVVCRCDGKPWLNSFITDQTGYQVSPFVALTTV